MSRQKIGRILFWIGVIFTVVWQALTWIQSPIQRFHTADELRGTAYAVWGVLFTIRIVGGGGMALSLLGALLAIEKKGSYFWLLGFLPSFINFGMYWEPSQHVPALFGIGGTLILLSYFGILWIWTPSIAKHQGAARAGRIIQLLGYSVIVIEGNLLCMYFGNPKQIALVDLPIPSGEVLNLVLSLGMLLLFTGHLVAARGSKDMAASPKLHPFPSQEK
jgi:hypothetical protein